MLDKDLIAKVGTKEPAVWLATWFGCGFMKSAPGTWGTLGGLPLAIFVATYGSPIIILVVTVLLFAIGYWAAGIFEKLSGEHDAGAIVIDEVAGICITFIAVAQMNFIMAALGFLFFRFFDILKPWPVSFFDKINGPMGVMADDIAAGIYAAICLMGVQILV